MKKLINLNEFDSEEPLVGILHYKEVYPKTWDKTKKAMPVNVELGGMQFTQPVAALSWFMLDAIWTARQNLLNEYEYGAKTITRAQWEERT